MSGAINIHELVDFFRKLASSSPPSPSRLSVLVAVSGGADSVALVHILHENRLIFGIERLGIVHVNHGLRGSESDGDEAFVREIAVSLGMEFFCAKLDVSAASDFDATTGIEGWARHERYEFFLSTAKANGFEYIATAHTMNDQAETLLLRLMRGTGVRGLRGILQMRGDGVIRPLLCVERRGIEEWLEERGLSYRVDSSNFDDKFSRNFVRSHIIPLMVESNFGAIRNIAACAESAARVWDIVSDKVAIWMGNYVLRVSDDTFHVEKRGLLDEKIAAEAMISLFEEYGIPASRLHIGRVMAAVDLSSGVHLLPDGWKFYPRADRVCFVKAASK